MIKEIHQATINGLIRGIDALYSQIWYENEYPKKFRWVSRTEHTIHYGRVDLIYCDKKRIILFELKSRVDKLNHNYNSPSNRAENQLEHYLNYGNKVFVVYYELSKKIKKEDIPKQVGILLYNNDIKIDREAINNDNYIGNIDSLNELYRKSTIGIGKAIEFIFEYGNHNYERYNAFFTYYYMVIYNKVDELNLGIKKREQKKGYAEYNKWLSRFIRKYKGIYNV